MLACLGVAPALAQVGRDGRVTATERTAGTRGLDGGGCPGGRREVTGSNNRMVLAGPCSLVQVSGSRNTVEVRLAPGARVMVSGSGNQVQWTSADPAGAPPRFEVNGTWTGCLPE